ncbi:hypothetical protein FQR65_LT17969 [Abscondita terminalis]|nr:hypothetical protein FQR65_LT17969 [Abscondita terminalis]
MKRCTLSTLSRRGFLPCTPSLMRAVRPALPDATRNHVKRMFTSSYEITILMKRIAERENLVVHEGHYRNNLDDCVKEETCKDKNSLDLVLLDYKQRYEWSRSFVNMCQNKKLQLDIISMFELNNALEIIRQQAIKSNYVLTLSTLSEYYTMPLIECIISPEVGVVGIHIPLLKKELIGLSMKKIVTPTYAWNDYTCSVDVPSINIAITQTHDRWTILIPKCDPFKEELCLVTETRNAETLPLLCVKQVLTGGPIKQFKAVCPITCRETGLSLISTIRASPVQITTGAYWKTLPDVIAYSATIPLTYSTSWTNELVEFIQSDQDAESCQEQDHTCKISSEIGKLNRLLSLELKRTHEAVDTEFLHVSNDRTVKRHPRALEFIGDFFSWCCGVATDRKIDSLVLSYEKMQIFLKQLRSGLENSLTQISNNSRIFQEYHDSVEDNLKEIKHKITNIQHYETEYRNKIRKSLNRNELQLKQTVMHVYDIVLHVLNLGRVMNRMEILATCKDHKIPPLIVTPQTLRTDLQNLSIELRKNGHSLAIPIDELSRYYKLSITDCTTTGNQLYVHIKIPIVSINQEWTLFELITTPFAWQNETCILMHETLFMAVSNNQTLKSISGTSLHHCKPYHDKLCYLPRFDSDALYGPQCAYKMYSGATVEDLSQHCSFRCHASQSMLVSEIDSDTFIITHPKNKTSITCPNRSLDVEENNYNQPGALQIELPCQCSLLVNQKEVISPRFPCSSNGNQNPELTHVLPATWSKLKTYVIQSAKHEIIFNNMSECLDTNWTTTVPHLNLSTPSIIGKLKESLDLAISNTPGSLYSFQSDTTFYVWNMILSFLCMYLLFKVNQRGGAIVALIHPVFTLDTDNQEVKILTYISSISLCIFVLVMLCIMFICCVKQGIIMSKSKIHADKRRFSSARSKIHGQSTGKIRTVELENFSRNNVLIIDPKEQNPNQPVDGCSTKRNRYDKIVTMSKGSILMVRLLMIVTAVLRDSSAEIFVTSGIYLERLPSINFYQTTTQLLFRFAKPKPLDDRINSVNLCKKQQKLCDSLRVEEDYFDNVNVLLESKPIDDNEKILADDGEIHDFQYATRNHVKRLFTSTYEISILTKRITERENIILREGTYRSNLDDFVKNKTYDEEKTLEIILLDYQQRHQWTRTFVTMCQNKKLQIDVISMIMLKNALDVIKQRYLVYDYVLALTTLSDYYTLPLIECVISPEVATIAIHVPLLKKELTGLTMKKIVTPTYAWNEYTCSVDIPSISIAITQTNNQWMILIPKCDPFKEELCLVTETRSAETLTLLCVKQLLNGGPIKQFQAVCPIKCRETGKHEQFVTHMGIQKFSVTHPKTNLVLKCPDQRYTLRIEPNIGSLWINVPCGCNFEDSHNVTNYPTFNCVDKKITYSQQHLIPAVWSQFPGLTLTPWDVTLPQFDSLHSCLNKNWIEEHIKDTSTPIITYFVILNFMLILSIISINLYVYFKFKAKLTHYQRTKVGPTEKSTFKLDSVKFTNPKASFTRPQDRPLPGPPQEEEAEYLAPNEINMPTTSATTPRVTTPNTGFHRNSPTTTTPKTLSPIISASPSSYYVPMNKSQYIPFSQMFAKDD